jgi:hypothetical protein
MNNKPTDTLELWSAFVLERTKLENRRIELKQALVKAKNDYLRAVTDLKGILIEGDPKKVAEAQNKVNEAITARDTAQLSVEALGQSTPDLKNFIAEHPDLKASQELEVFVDTALPEIEELEKQVKYLLDVRVGKHLKAYFGRLRELAEITTRYYNLTAKYNMAQDFKAEPQRKRVYKIPASQGFTVTVEELRKELGRWPSYFGS